MPSCSRPFATSAKPSTSSTTDSTATGSNRRLVDGWRAGDLAQQVPNPWVALAARPDVVLHHDRIPEPGRYYDRHRIVVLRRGLLLEEQRRYLWHELVHADRRDQACTTDARAEQRVDEAALRWAMPMVSLRWALGQEHERHLVAGMLKLPENWIQARLDLLTDAERVEIRTLMAGLWAEEVA